MKVAIRADASQRIGTGHLARCLTLATELKGQGNYVLFICRHITESMQIQIRNKGHDVVVLSRRPAMSAPDLAHSAWLGVSQAQDAADTLAVLRAYAPLEWLGVDHSRLD